MSLGRRLNMFELKMDRIEEILRDVETHLLAKTSQDDLRVKQAAKRLESLELVLDGLVRELKQATHADVWRTRTLGRPSGSRAFAVRDSANAHKAQLLRLNERLKKLGKYCALLIARLGAPTPSDVFAWAADLRGIDQEHLVTAAREAKGQSPESPDPFSASPESAAIVLVAYTLLLIGRLRKTIEDRVRP